MGRPCSPRHGDEGTVVQTHDISLEGCIHHEPVLPRDDIPGFHIRVPTLDPDDCRSFSSAFPLERSPSAIAYPCPGPAFPAISSAIPERARLFCMREPGACAPSDGERLVHLQVRPDGVADEGLAIGEGTFHMDIQPLAELHELGGEPLPSWTVGIFVPFPTGISMTARSAPTADFFAMTLASIDLPGGERDKGTYGAGREEARLPVHRIGERLNIHVECALTYGGPSSVVRAEPGGERGARRPRGGTGARLPHTEEPRPRGWRSRWRGRAAARGQGYTMAEGILERGRRWEDPANHRESQAGTRM